MARYTTGYEDIMVSSTAIGFTAETAGTAKRARVQVEDAPIRVRVDGTDPTASVGELFTPGDSFVVEGDLTAFAAICADGDDATLRVTYDTVTPAAVASIIRESPTAHSVGHQSMSVTIENGAALSDIIDFREKIIMQIHMPDAWTEAQLGLYTASARGGTYQPLYDRSGSLITIQVAASKNFLIEGEKICSSRFIKLWSQNGSGVDTNQEGDRVIGVDLI